MTDREAMKMALYALEFNYPLIEDYGNKEQLDTHHEAIMALCKSLAQPEQEPFGYFQLDLRMDAWVQNRTAKKGVAFYTAPPSKPWVGLTDDEIAMYDKRLSGSGVARDIEAKLKEKNDDRR